MTTAVVVGGGPAGLAAGLGLLRSGFDVQIHEQRPDWKGRVCGSFLNPDAVRALSWLGLLEEAKRRGAVPITKTRLITAAGRSRSISIVQGGTPSLAFQRRKLEDLLVEEFVSRGGQWFAGSRAQGIERDGDGWSIEIRRNGVATRVHSNLLVRADGRFSNVSPSSTGGWFGWNATFRNVAQSAGEMNMFFGSAGYIGVLSFSDGTTNVCGLVKREAGAISSWNEVFQAARQDMPAFDQQMTGAVRTDDWRGVGPLPFTTQPRVSDGALLAGDAGAVSDPFMGEGIGRALATAPLLFEAVRGSGGVDLDSIYERYSASWNRAYRSRLLFGQAARWLLEHPRLSATFLDSFFATPFIRSGTSIFHRGAAFATDPRWRTESAK